MTQRYRIVSTIKKWLNLNCTLGELADQVIAITQPNRTEVERLVRNIEYANYTAGKCGTEDCEAAAQRKAEIARRALMFVIYPD